MGADRALANSLDSSSKYPRMKLNSKFFKLNTSLPSNSVNNPQFARADSDIAVGAQRNRRNKKYGKAAEAEQ